MIHHICLLLSLSFFCLCLGHLILLSRTRTVRRPRSKTCMLPAICQRCIPGDVPAPRWLLCTDDDVFYQFAALSYFLCFICFFFLFLYHCGTFPLNGSLLAPLWPREMGTLGGPEEGLKWITSIAFPSTGSTGARDKQNSPQLCSFHVSCGVSRSRKRPQEQDMKTTKEAKREERQGRKALLSIKLYFKRLPAAHAV